MRIFFDHSGQKIYISEDRRLAGSLKALYTDQVRWVLWEASSPDAIYKFPNEKALVEFIVWAESTTRFDRCQTRYRGAMA